MGQSVELTSIKQRQYTYSVGVPYLLVVYIFQVVDSKTKKVFDSCSLIFKVSAIQATLVLPHGENFGTIKLPNLASDKKNY